VNRLLFWPVTRPVQAATLVAVLTILLAAQIPRLELDTSPESLMAVNDPGRRHYDAFVRRFGSDVVALVVIKADDVFTAPVLRVVQRLSDALERLDHVTRVESLTTVRNIRGEGDTLTTEPLVDRAIPEEPTTLARIRRDALSNRVLVGSLVSASARTTAIAVVAMPQAGDRQFDRRLAARVETLIAAEATPALTIYQFGGPFINATLADDIRRDIRTLIPLSVVVLFLFLLLQFRVIQGLVIPLTTGLISLIWTLGLMAVLGLPLSILTVMVPPILIVIGSAEDVHLLTEYHRLLQEGAGKLVAIQSALRRGAWPVVITTATTVVGFGSVATSTIPAQVHFGYASALGLTANFVVTMIVLPLLLLVFPIPRRLQVPAPSASMNVLPSVIDWLGRFNLRHRVPIAVVSGLLVAASLVGWWNIRVNTDQLDFYPTGAPLRLRAEDLQRSLTGFGAFHIVVDSGQESGITDPALLRAIVGLQDFLGGMAEIDRTVGVTDYLRTMHREMNGGDPAFETIPQTREQVAQYLLFMEGPELARYVDFTASAASLIVRHHITGTWELSELLKRLEAHVAAHVPAGASVQFTGRAVLLRNAADALAVNELVSLSTTFVMIGVIHSLFFMSLRVGLLSLIPNIVPVLLIYGLMGLLGIPLDLATAMIATLAIGIAVDDTVHHVVTYRRELRAHRDRRMAMFQTLHKQARPILYVSLALAAGFFVFGFSRFAPVIHFGLLSGVVMLIALVGELVLTPIVMYTTTPLSAAGRRAPGPVSERSATAPHS
jgi:uncharacterized protein